MDPTRHPLVAGMVGIVDDWVGVVDCVVAVGWDLEALCLVGSGVHASGTGWAVLGLSLRLYLLHADLLSEFCLHDGNIFWL